MSNTSGYGVIVADPPWQYGNGGNNGAAAKHYPTMKDDDLASLDVASLAADNSVLIMWATWPKLDVAMKVVDAWGFSYVTGFPWIKLKDDPLADLFGNVQVEPSWGTGYWIRGCSEPILIARRGTPSAPESCDVPLGLISKRMKHSKKPKNVHEYAELLNGPYLEMFARRERPGWDVFGNEISNSIDIPNRQPNGVLPGQLALI